MPDLEAFQAPDGTVISGRVAYNEYCRRNNVTNPADFKEEWARKEDERKKLFSGDGYDRERRRAELARNYREFRTYGEYRQMIENLGRRK